MSSNWTLVVVNVVVVCLSILPALSAATSISDVAFGQRVVNERRLLQVAKPCSVNFENQNYSIITSQCKGPDYSRKPCCDAFKEFACPFAAEINDLTTDCAKVMFSYITRIGQYPAGLFASLCREGKEGLTCPAPAPAPTPSGSLANEHYSSCSLIILVQMLALLLFSLQCIV